MFKKIMNFFRKISKLFIKKNEVSLALDHNTPLTTEKGDIILAENQETLIK